MASTKIYIIAGEASGDNIGARLIAALKKQCKDIKIAGIGGQKMTKNGMQSLFPMSDLSIMGFVEIVPHIPKILKRIKQTLADIEKFQPDVLVTIDSPGFCLRVVKQLQNKNIKLVHYVAPTVWAYKPQRAEKFASLYDHLLTILPFEKPYFDKVNLGCTYVGHPIVESFDAELKSDNFANKYHISSNDLVITMLPGSRKGELKYMLPEFTKALEILAKKHKNLKVIVPTLPHISGLLQEKLNNSEITYIVVDSEEEKLQALKLSKMALAKSGTATLELSLYNVPMIIAYKANKLTAYYIRKLIQIKFANLLNISRNEEIIPEFIQEKCQGEILAKAIDNILSDKKQQDMQVIGGQKFMRELGLGDAQKPSQKAAQQILKICKS